MLPANTLSARPWALPGQLAKCRHRTVTPDPGILNPESVMEPSRFAGSLDERNFKIVFFLVSEGRLNFYGMGKVEGGFINFFLPLGWAWISSVL